MTWRAQAACAGVDPELFFVHEGQGARKDWSFPRAICASCPVQFDCHLEGVEQKDTWSMRAGVAPEPRGVVVKLARCGTVAGYSVHRRRGEAACDACLEARRRHRVEKEAANNNEGQETA